MVDDDDDDGEDEEVDALGAVRVDDAFALFEIADDLVLLLLLTEVLLLAEFVAELVADEEEVDETVDDDEAGVEVVQSAFKLFEFPVCDTSSLFQLFSEFEFDHCDCCCD